MNALLIAGSRNPAGQTALAVDAVRKGLLMAGATTDLVFLPALKIECCRQCDDQGWGTCRTEGRCIIQDDFGHLVEKIRVADALVFGTPVYWGDLSESLRAFTDRLRRICTHDAGRASIAGKPCIGVCVAGGGGGGAYSCCVSLERVLTFSGLDLVDMIPVRRQNLQAKMPALELAGKWLASSP